MEGDSAAVGGADGVCHFGGGGFAQEIAAGAEVESAGDATVGGIVAHDEDGEVGLGAMEFVEQAPTFALQDLHIEQQHVGLVAEDVVEQIVGWGEEGDGEIVLVGKKSAQSFSNEGDAGENCDVEGGHGGWCWGRVRSYGMVVSGQ